jgi:hypothetical protein
MKRELLTLGVVVCVLSLLPGCALIPTTGSGNVVTRDKTVTGFDRLDISHGFKVDVRLADNFSVIIRIDDNLEKYLEVAKRGSTLHIGLKPGRDVRNATLQAEITMPELAGLKQSGGSHCTASGFESTAALHLDLSGGSHATLSGSAGDVTIDASGGSHATLSALVAANANVEASGGSHVTVNVTGRLDADASGGSHVYYLGSPTLGRIDESSGSQIRRR